MAPADASEGTSGAGGSTRHSCDIALKKLLDLQRTRGASGCADLRVKHAGGDQCWLHAQSGNHSVCRGAVLPHLAHARSSSCGMSLWHLDESTQSTHRVDQLSVASDWGWGSLQQVSSRGCRLQLQGLRNTPQAAHQCVGAVSGSAGHLGRHWRRRGQEVAPADASEGASGAGGSTCHSCDIALKKLLELQRASRASGCAGLPVKHAGGDHCRLHAQSGDHSVCRGAVLPKLAHARSSNSGMCSWHLGKSRQWTHRVDQLSVASDWWWGGLQQAALRLDLQYSMIKDLGCQQGPDKHTMKYAPYIRHAAGEYRHTSCCSSHLCSC